MNVYDEERVMIHPFDDGNERVGRAVTDYQLAEHYPAVMQLVSFSKHISMDNKNYFWQRHKDTSLTSHQHKVINRLLDTGERFEGGMITRKYAGMTKCSRITASRDLNDLLTKNILQKRPGKGQSTSYELCPIVSSCT